MRSAAALRGWLARELQGLATMRSRPVLADPFATIENKAQEIERGVKLMRREITYLLDTESNAIAALRNQVSTLGPSATLARGYAVVQVVPRDGTPPQVVMGIEQSPPGSQLRIRVANGSIVAAAMQTKSAD